MNNLEERAKAFAANWHGSINQLRKYSGEPYINHPIAVADLVRSVPHDEAMLAAALCHDVVEDTPCTLEMLRLALGNDVAILVAELTDVSRPTDGNRAIRKEIDRQHTATASPRAKTVKLADLIDNSRSILACDPDFAKVYLREKERLLAVLTEGDPTLHAMATQIVVQAQEARLQEALRGVDPREQWKGLPSGSVIILHATVGSTVHGTAVDGTADRDEMAICIEPPDKVVGLHHFETMVYRTQPDGVRSGPGDLDLTVHTLRKFTRLAAKGNPTILLPLYVKPDALIDKTHYYGHALRDARSMFLSKQVGKAFLGYLIAQKERLIGERGQMRIKRQELIDAYGYDTKYAAHVVRLAHQGIEMMTTGSLSLPMRKAEREEVLAIRTGKLTFQQTMTRAGELEAQLRDSLDTDLLPEHPDEVAIDRFVVNAYLNMWQSGRAQPSQPGASL